MFSTVFSGILCQQTMLPRPTELSKMVLSSPLIGYLGADR